ncbi:hypothetical protein [Streptomyces sp. NPDC057702]|uniref:hypothetical protein n=1 Tax=Streptomyces sp. NPDC057702 TaxID=3346221 RepID=UPI00368AF302
MTESPYAYEYERQRAGQLALGRLLSRAVKAGLRPLSWIVSPQGVLIGQASGAQSRADLERLFEHWVAFLGEGLVREADQISMSTSEVVKTAHTTQAPGTGQGITVRLRITVTSDWEPYL